MAIIEDVSARALISLLIWLRQSFRQVHVTWADMLARVSVVDNELPGFDGMKVLKLNVRGLLHNGLGLGVCHHRGVRGMFWHGTRDVRGLLFSHGRFRNSNRSIGGFNGWWMAVMPHVALQYSALLYAAT